MKRNFYLPIIFIVSGVSSMALQCSFCPMSEQIINHLQVIRELKTIRDKKVKLAASQKTKKNTDQQKKEDEKWSQTEAHLSFPSLHNKTVNCWQGFLDRYPQLINNILENEYNHSDEHYIFYHAQRKEFIILQDFIKEIFELLQMSQKLDSFAFLRFWHQMPHNLDVNGFIDENNAKKGVWSDHETDISKQLLSVNLALFGNCTFIDAWECTFDYFLADRSVMIGGSVLNKVFTELFDYFSFDTMFIEQLLDLLPLLQSNHGLLFQICIPKKLVDKCVYLSWPCGRPFSTPIVESIFDAQKKRHLKISPVLALYTQGKRLLLDNGLLRQKLEQAWDLDGFWPADDNPERIAQHLDRLQARILFTRDIMLSPVSGVKIFRYTTIDDAVMADYTSKLKKIAHDVVTAWLENGSSRESIAGSKLDILLTQIDDSIINNCINECI